MSFVQQIGLADIAEPGPVSQWPAIGWWILIFLSVIFFSAVFYYAVQYLRKRQRLNNSLTALELVTRNYSRELTNADFCGRLNIVLKQHLAQAGYHQSMPLYGSSWCEFLQQHIPVKHHKDINTFVNQLYQPDRESFRCNETSENTSENNSDDGSINALVWPVYIKSWLRKLPC